MENTLKEELETATRVYSLLVDFFVTYSFQVMGAILILLIGYFLARYVSRVVLRLCEKKGLDITLRLFIGRVIYLVVMVCFVIISLGKFGISLTPFLAAVGALALGAGMALQGLVSNYGAGLSIILTRPFVVGNTIKVQDVSGVVEEIKLATTILVTEDGEEITIPNKHIIGEILHNSFEYRVVENIVGIDYSSDSDAAIKIIQDSLASLEFVAKEPSPQVGIDGFGESSIDIGVRFWVPTRSFFKSKYQANNTIWQALQAGGIQIPFPRRDVKLLEK